MRLAGLLLSGALLLACFGQEVTEKPSYTVAPAITERNLTVFPVMANRTFDTSGFLTLDEGIRNGQVTVTELGQDRGLVRPEPDPRPHWDERWPIPQFPPIPAPPRPQVNTLALINHADRPLILLAGEIVTGGKQDRIVGKDRIIPPHSEPIALDVFCVEPNRWIAASTRFNSAPSVMAQPAVRMKAMAEQNQQHVWAEVAKSRAMLASGLTAADITALQSSSSYARALNNSAVENRLESIAAPIEHSYETLRAHLRSQKAVGAVAAVNGHIIWADVFASPELLDKYWPKLIRSYAAEAIGPEPVQSGNLPTQKEAQQFLDHLYGRRESIESEPGVYRNTELDGEDFKAFVLTSLLPNTGFPVHIAKMQE